MIDNLLVLNINNIKERIYSIRNIQVMLDSDLAMLYNVEIRTLNQAVKRNIDRFPEHFMFQLTKEELEILKSQFATSSWSNKTESEILRSQFVTLKKGSGKHRKYLSFAFTEQGVAMLSGVLNLLGSQHCRKIY